LGLRVGLCACSLLPGSLDVSFSLKEKVLTWSVDLGSRGKIYVFGLFTWDVQSSFFSFRREGLSLKGRKFNLRESLVMRAPGGRLGGRERRSLLGGELIRDPLK